MLYSFFYSDISLCYRLGKREAHQPSHPHPMRGGAPPCSEGSTRKSPQPLGALWGGSRRRTVAAAFFSSLYFFGCSLRGPPNCCCCWGLCACLSQCRYQRLQQQPSVSFCFFSPFPSASCPLCCPCCCKRQRHSCSRCVAQVLNPSTPPPASGGPQAAAHP